MMPTLVRKSKNPFRAASCFGPGILPLGANNVTQPA